MTGAEAVDAVLREFTRVPVGFSMAVPPRVDTQALAAEVVRLRTDLETERMRLAACGVAALGGNTSDCLDEYKSASLGDVIALRQRAEEDRARLDWWDSKREPITEQHPDSDEPRLIAYGWQGFAGEFTDLRAAIDAARPTDPQEG